MNALTMIIIITLFILLSSGTNLKAFAVEPGEILSNPKLEARARSITKGLRCIVCQNQSIDDSNASVARDMRLLVRERLIAGDNNKQVVDYIVERYGDYVLLRPPFQTNTLALWIGPPFLALIILFIIIRFLITQRNQSKSSSDHLTFSDSE